MSERTFNDGPPATQDLEVTLTREQWDYLLLELEQSSVEAAGHDLLQRAIRSAEADQRLDLYVAGQKAREPRVLPDETTWMVANYDASKRYRYRASEAVRGVNGELFLIGSTDTPVLICNPGTWSSAVREDKIIEEVE